MTKKKIQQEIQKYQHRMNELLPAIEAANREVLQCQGAIEALQKLLPETQIAQ